MTPPLAASLRIASSVGVGERDGLGRDLDRVERRPVAGVRDVHEHAGLVHRRDDRGAEVADAAVHAIRAAAAEQVLAVVGELRTALAELVERLDVLRPAEVLGVLQAHDDRDLAGRFRAVEVGGLVHDGEQIRIARREAHPAGQEAEGLFADFGAAGADRIVEARDAARAERRDLGRRQRIGVSLRTEVDLQHAQHVDDERAADEVDGARGIFARAVGEGAEGTEIEHREGQGGCGAGRALEQCATCRPP
jgi:hypothetical protein